ncbi:Trp biosynthesis-associated membrane protein [Microbacterium atlanticum]|uniref:Trp biosynthesis-associated membrane protein n=1 Tax=Microbacterium atlanticum TaxID=2782168 RepID=UPI0030804534
MRLRRSRLIAVGAMVLCGAVGVISSTQTWLTVVLRDGAQDQLDVPGASAIPVLAPLSLAVLALGAALSIVGLVLRYLFGTLALLIAAALTVLTAPVVFAPPITAVASVVTQSTGIAGEASVARLIAAIGTTPWPAVSLVTWAVLFATGVFVLATAHTWPRSGRRYRTDDTAASSAPSGARPHDAAGSRAIDDWDDLSRGQDPTA